MELFTYLMAKNDHNTSVKKDLFSYLLGKGQSGTYTDYSGTSLSINNTKKAKMKVNLLGNTSQYSTTGKNLSSLKKHTFVRENSRTYDLIFDTPLPAGTYTLSCKITSQSGLTSTNGLSFQIIDESVSPSEVRGYFTQIVNSTTSPYKSTQTITGQATKLYFYLNSSLDSSATITIDEIQIESGSSATSYEKYTGGIASPNPSYPQSVNVVSGDNEVVVCGKNLLDLSKCTAGYTGFGLTSSIENGGIRIRGKATGSTGPHAWLIFSMPEEYYNELFVEKNASIKGFSNQPITSLIPNVSGSGYRVNISMSIVNNQTYDFMVYPFVYTGTEPISFEPYQSNTYPIHLGTYELCKIGTYQDKFIRNSGKNLFDKDNANILNGYIDTSTIVSNGNYKSYYIECKPNTKYTISRTGTSSLYACTSQTTPTLSGSISNKTNGNTSSVTITTDANANYLIVQAYRSSYDDATIVLDTLMINEGSIALPYEPYGDGDWYLEKHIGKVVFTGDTYLDRSTTNENYTAFYYIQNDMKLDGTLYSNYFSQVPIATITNVIGVGIAPHNTLPRIYIGIATSTASNSNELKTWLGTHNTSVYYQLATPTYTKIEGTLKDELEAVWRANSYKGQTNINQVNNDLPFELDVSVKVSA